MPKTFRGYEIHEKIGSGGMSTLYRGTQKTLNRKVALKLLHPGLAEDEQFIARFELEARTASGIGHRNIVSVIDFGSEDDVYYIVMEYVDGLNLKEVHQKVGKLAHEIALAILEEVSYGLNAAHEAGVIHRDIKPGNVLLSSSGDVKIADFGLARQMSDIDRLSGLTVPGSVLGTPAYMSPEQATGRDVDHRSDIYSLGVMAYELLTREKPFQGKTYSDIRDGIVNREPEPLRMKVPVMPEIETLVATMLAKDPDRRYQSMRQVIRAVENCMESLDPSEGLLKHRRKYLAQFAKDPVGFSEKLRRMSVSSHLDRGFHYKNMGFAKIDSAMQEFRYVLFLDPDNENASAAVGELESQSKASAAGGGGAADGGGAGSGGAPETSQGAADDGGDGGGTRILSPGDVHAELDVSRTELARGPVRTRSRTGSRKGPHARWIVVAAGVLVIAAFAFWQLVLKPQPAETLAGERVTEGSEIVPAQAATGGEPTLDQPVSSVAVSSQPAGADVAIRRPGTDAFRPLGVTPLTSEEIEPGTWELLLTGDDAEVTRTIQVEDGAVTSLSIDIDQDADRGRIAVSTVPPQARVGVRRNGTGEFEQLSAATPTTTSPLKTGPWQVRVTLAGYEPMTRDVTVRKDQMTDLSFALRQERPKPAPDGYASVVAAPYADVYLDGKQVATQARRSLVQIASGRDHTLELRHPTFGIKRFTDVRVAAGDTLDLGSFTFEWSSLRVYCEPRVVVDVTIDGVAQDRQTPYSGHVGSGSHRIVLSRPGWLVHHAVVTNAEGKESLVTPSGADRGLTIEVAVNDEVSVQVILEKSE